MHLQLKSPFRLRKSVTTIFREQRSHRLEVDVRELSGCTCLRLRRAARRITQIYDHLLEPAGLTVNQFSLLGQLYGATRSRRIGLPIGALAERMGMDPTTLNRNLKPLEAQGLVRNAADAADRRVRSVLITAKGATKLQKAIPFWRRAQAQVEEALGVEATLALNGLLDLSSAKLSK
jgi:DNA-binding MarR family transcriptional regulator